MLYQLRIGEQDFAVKVGTQSAGRLRVDVNGTSYEVTVAQDESSSIPRPGAVAPVRQVAQGTAPAAAPAGSRPAPAPMQGAVLAPIPGLVVAIPVKVGDTVLVGQTVAVMEAMKMENNLVSQLDGTVLEILVQKGAEVATGDVLLRIG
jgi:glutaconyl-CoA/methylmalonyl-CoA decarboxylase subunit gamma